MFRQLPAAALWEPALVVLPAGSLIDPEILRAEIEAMGIDRSRLIIDARASVITAAHRASEINGSLVERIGSTGSGTGAALEERISRVPSHRLASSDPFLRQFVRASVAEEMRTILDKGRRVIIEGTQGFGLSIWHGPEYPWATSRDTTAAGFVSETGLAPHDVDDVVLVLRAFPIRVGGNSGTLANEIDWPTLAAEAGLPSDFVELTSATKRVRRVARFDPAIVKQAIMVNRPHRIVLNHLDYVDSGSRYGNIGSKGRRFLEFVEDKIGKRVDLVGTGPDTLVKRPSITVVLANAG